MVILCDFNWLALMDFFELTNEQIRRQVDAQQLYRAWRQAAVQTWNEHGGQYAAPASWRKIAGKEYLVLRTRGIRKHVGPRSKDTEAYAKRYRAERDRIVATQVATYAELKRMAPVNRALQLGRMPNLLADIIRKLDEFGFLGTKATVIGTNALYAYEAMAGVHIRPALLETSDADILWDAGQTLKLAIENIRPPSIIALLQKVDKSFAIADYGIAARNKTGFIVELISPKADAQPEPTGLGVRDLEVTPYSKMEGLLSLPRFEAIPIDRSGFPFRMVVPDIRAFTLHKMWTSKQASRQPEKRRRDAAQAKMLANLAENILGLSLNDTELASIPKYLLSTH
ncbi:MAG: GSU2403 family nucleotidyltransferase fold protein [Rhodomicrobium sp.]